MSTSALEKPKEKEDSRETWRIVAKLVNRVNALMNMTALLEGKTRGMGELEMRGDRSFLRIYTTPGGFGPTIGDSLQITSSFNPSNVGQSINFTATVVPNINTNVSATGTIQFYIDGTAFGSPVTLQSGSAISPNTTSLALGSHTIAAHYSGDANFFPADASLTQNVRQVSTVTVTSSDNPSNNLEGVTFTATVTSGATGTVQFKVNGSPFGAAVAIVGNQAVSGSISSLAIGSNTIEADYSGDTTYGPASGTLTQTVTAFPTAFTVTPISGVSSGTNMQDGVAATWQITAPGSWSGWVSIPTNIPTNPFMTEFAFGGAIKWSGTPSVSFNAGQFRLTSGVGQFTLVSNGALGTNYAGGEFASGTIDLTVRDPYDSSQAPTINGSSYLACNYV